MITTSPLIILLDIDGTLIGDITPQVVMYEIIKSIRKRSKLPYNIKQLHDKLRSGIIRPYFKEFFNELKEYGVEIFIYTASEKTWAEYIVKHIEIATGVKFNRPLFTRNDCEVINGEYKKSISKVRPMITRSLTKKYGKIDPSKFNNMIMPIDNNPVYYGEEAKNLLLCDTYNFNIPENIPAVINKELFEIHGSLVMSILSGYYPKLKFTKNFMKFERQFYYKYVDDLNNSIKQRDSSHSDNLFKTIKNFIIYKKISSFNEGIVKYLNSKIKVNHK